MLTNCMGFSGVVKHSLHAVQGLKHEASLGKVAAGVCTYAEMASMGPRAIRSGNANLMIYPKVSGSQKPSHDWQPELDKFRLKLLLAYGCNQYRTPRAYRGPV